MGGGYDPYDSPNQPFSTFAYSVVVENSKSEFNVTEKLLQSLLNECVPIYWGAPLEHLGFNLNGIISFTHIGELPKILSEISMEDFESRRSAVQENFKVAQTYMSKEINILRSISGLPGLEQFTDLGKMRSGLGFDEPVEPGRTYTENQSTESFLGRLLRQWRYRFQFAWHVKSVLRVNKILGSRGQSDKNEPRRYLGHQRVEKKHPDYGLRFTRRSCPECSLYCGADLHCFQGVGLGRRR
jgi:hypothetical protein